jgi:imidazolonepropionase-like amidohydrolase
MDAAGRSMRGLLLGLVVACAAPGVHAAAFLELVDFELVDGTGAPARHVDRLVARDGVIVAIDAAGSGGTPAKGDRWQRIDLGGGWVMPGLVDTHVHVARFPDTRAKAERILRAALRGGVTSVRDLAGDARALADLERAIGAGELVAPTIVYSAMFGGPDIFQQGPTASMASGREPGDAHWARVLTTPDELPRLVAQAAGTGARNVKVYGDLDAPLATALIRESKRQGLQTTAHGTVFPARPSDLVEAGVGSLSHAPYLVWEGVDVVPDDYRKRIAGPWQSIAPDHPKLRALYARMAAKGTFLDATLFVFRAMNDYSPEVNAPWAKEAFAWSVRAVRAAHAAGVRVTTGTDWFEPRDEWGLPNTHEELALLVGEAGFSAMDAIVAGTRNGAAALGLGATHGTIENGKFADLVVLEASPLEDIRNTTKIRLVVRHGVVVDPAF